MSPVSSSVCGSMSLCLPLIRNLHCLSRSEIALVVGNLQLPVHNVLLPTHHMSNSKRPFRYVKLSEAFFAVLRKRLSHRSPFRLLNTSA